jgi:trigger factor
LIPEGYRTALEQEQIQPVAVLDVQSVEFAPGKAMSFSVICDVAPEFDLIEYKGIPLNSNPAVVAEAELDRAMARILDQFATYDDVERPVGPDDLARIDFTATVDGQPLKDVAPAAGQLNEARDFWVHAGDNAFLPEFATGLEGMEIDATKTIDVRFPDEFAEESLRGKSAQYEVTLRSVREKKISKLNEEQLKQLGVESEEEMREAVRADMERNAEQMERRRLKNDLVQHLLERTVFDVPESVLQEETRNTVYEMVQGIMKRGTEKQDIEEQREQIFDAASQSASGKVKLRYILSRIANEESIEVDKREINERVTQMAVQYNVEPEKLREELASRQQLDNLQQDIRFEKTLEFLLDKANVS